MNDPLKLKPEQRREITSALALLTQLGLNVTITVAGCVLLGRFLDARLGVSPLFVLIFALLGMASAFYSLYKTAMNAAKPRKKPPSAQKTEDFSPHDKNSRHGGDS